MALTNVVRDTERRNAALHGMAAVCEQVARKATLAMSERARLRDAARVLRRVAAQELAQLAQPVEVVGDFTLDRRTWVVQVAGRTVLLTPTEWALLSFLLRHVGQVVSMAQLVAGVWGYDTDSSRTDLNMVTAAVSRLRRKIEPEPRRPRYLKRWHGYGYVLWSTPRAGD